MSVLAWHAILACRSSSSSMCRVFFIPLILPYLDGNISHITRTLPNKPLQRTRSPQRHRVQSSVGPGGLRRHSSIRRGRSVRSLDKYIRTYILWLMGERAKIFQNVGSQAVRLPKSCRFSKDQDEVMVRRAGRQVILEPVDEWPPEFLACLGAWHEDIPKPSARTVGSRRNPFEPS